MLVQAIVAELTVETLHIRGLCWLAGLYQAQRRHAVAVVPAVELVAGKLRTLIGSQHTRHTAECADPIEHPRHVLARDAVVDRDIDRFLHVVIDDRPAIEPTTVLETVADKAHRPDLVRRQRHSERTALHRNSAPAFTSRHL